MKFSGPTLAFLLLVSSNHLMGGCQAWFSSSHHHASSRRPLPMLEKANHPTTALHYSNDETTDGNNKNPPSSQSSSTVERIVISGVSVSLKGFHVLFQTRKGVLPLPVTRDPQDSYKATSPESLTILQLLSQVDMAGAILPPELLAQMAIVQSELEYYNSTTTTETTAASTILAKYMQEQLPKDCESYRQAHPWSQSRMRLPQITLDQLSLVYDPNTQSTKCQLTCALPKNILWTLEADIKDKLQSTSFVVEVTPELVQPFAYQYNAETSHIFTSLALALRYKAPIVLEVLDNSEDDYYYPPQQLEQYFAQRTSIQNLQQQSSRISQNIEKGFEANQLMGALQIAKRLGDKAAIQKIQDKLAEYDNMDDLPVVGGQEEETLGSDVDCDLQLKDLDDSDAFQ